jgi:tape measure domain-containing protein
MATLEYSVGLDTAGARASLRQFRESVAGTSPTLARARNQIRALDQQRLRPQVDLGILSERMGLAQQALAKFRNARTVARVSVDTARVQGAVAGAQVAIENLRKAAGRIVLGAVVTRFMGPMAGVTAALGGVRALANKIVVDAITAPIINKLRPVNVDLNRLRDRAKIVVRGTINPLISLFPAAEARLRLLRRRAMIKIDATAVSFMARMPQVNAALTKARNMAAKIALGLVIGPAVDKLISFGARLAGIRRKAEQPFQLRATASGAGLSAAGGGMSLLGGAASGLLAPLAGVAVGMTGVGMAANAMKESVMQAAEMESVEVGFETMLRSAAKAKAMLASLKQFADTTPLKFPELAAASRSLLAFGIPAQQVMQNLRQIGDISSGVRAPIGEIAEIFGKARVQGTLFAEDVNQLTGRGIPVIGEFAKQLGVAESQVRKLTETGAINFSMLQKAFSSLTSRGGMFYGMLTTQGQTALGKLSTMQDAVGALYREFGKPLLTPFKQALDYASEAITKLKVQAAAWGAAIGAALEGGMALLRNGDLGATVGTGIKVALMEGANTLHRGAEAAAQALSSMIDSVTKRFTDAITSQSAWRIVSNSLQAAGWQLVAVMQNGVADVLKSMDSFGIGRARVSRVLEEARKSQGMADEKSASARQGINEFRSIGTGIGAIFSEAWKKGQAVFNNTYAGTPDLIDATDAKTGLAGLLNRANALRHPAPAPNVQYDNEGLPSGPDAPWYAPGSTRPVKVSFGSAIDQLQEYRAQTASIVPWRRKAPDLLPIIGKLFGVQRPTLPVAPDLGPGYINGRLSSLALAPGLNARASALIDGRPGPGNNREAQQTAANTKETVTAVKSLETTIRSVLATQGRF